MQARGTDESVPFRVRTLSSLDQLCVSALSLCPFVRLSVCQSLCSTAAATAVISRRLRCFSINR